VKISFKVPNVRKTASSAKTLLVKLPLKQKLIFSGVAVIVLGAVLTTSVIALSGNAQPQVVKTAPVAQLKKAPVKKVADASTTAPVAATPTTPAASQSTTTGNASTAQPTTPTCAKTIMVNGTATCFGANRTVAPSNPTPKAPSITFSPTTVTYNISGHDNLFISEDAFANSDYTTISDPTVWSYNDPSGNFVATMQPVKNADTGVQRGVWLQFAYPSFGPDRAGSYPISVTVTDTTTGLSSTGTFTIVATAN
jgi:hypothetical protein